MLSAKYIPRRGDIVWINFDPQVGREQNGYRPALILSPLRYNKLTGLCLLCPMTSRSKGYFGEVEVDLAKVRGVVLSDQIKSLDWKGRRIRFIASGTDAILREVQRKSAELITGNDM